MKRRRSASSEHIDSTISIWQHDRSKAVVTLVFYQLDLLSLNRSVRVCKLWRDSGNEPYVWNLLFEKYFGRSSIEYSTQTKWKDEFRREYQNAKAVGMRGGNISRSFVYYSHSIMPKPLAVPQVC